MPRQIPLFICIVFILYLLRQDTKREPNVSYALWVPWLWFAIYASRGISYWFGMGASADSSDYYLEGSPFDRNFFIALIVIGLIILIKRRPNWNEILKKNKFIFIYILYLGLSALWSDYAFVSFKRWIKELGNIIMVLIILTESSPAEAVKTVIIRCTYVMLPLSWILNRYFPEISRIYSVSGGNPQFTGITPHKNSLGILCLISAMCLLWSFLKKEYLTTEGRIKNNIFIFAIFAVLIAWLHYNAHSATALAGTIMGCSIILLFNTEHVKKNTRLINYYAGATIIILLTIHLSFDLMYVATSFLGRDETLTGRTDFWVELIALGTNPLIGTGYESFWLGDRIAYFWDKYWWHPNQAHNGYIELYLNIGIIGLALLIFLVISALRNIKTNISRMDNYDYQIFRLAYILVALIINMTEAYFKGIVWFVFLLLTMEPPHSTNIMTVIKPNHIHKDNYNENIGI